MSRSRLLMLKICYGSVIQYVKFVSSLVRLHDGGVHFFGWSRSRRACVCLGESVYFDLSNALFAQHFFPLFSRHFCWLKRLLYSARAVAPFRTGCFLFRWGCRFNHVPWDTVMYVSIRWLIDWLYFVFVDMSIHWLIDWYFDRFAWAFDSWIDWLIDGIHCISWIFFESI